jgi:hypothetical protein
MSRRATLIFVHVFVAVQLLLPLTYYVVREDPFDERFAWRMFSAERMAQGRPRFRVGDSPRPEPLGATFHEAWVTIAQRGRQDVLDAMARRLCADNPGKPVKLEMTCQLVGGARVQRSAGLWDLCGGEAGAP